MEKSSTEVSSPLSTVDEIHRRLARPSSVSTHSRLEKRVERRLEGYLDSNLLSAIRARIGVKREKVREMKMKSKEFEWPVDELKVWEEGGVRRESAAECGAAVDLGDDNDAINGVEEEEKECDLFGRFEETALKRLRR